MAIYIKQGVNETLEIEMPFTVSLLSKFTVDIFQGGELIVSKPNTECTVTGNTVSCHLMQTDALKFAPQRASLTFRGKYTDGGTVIIENIPCVIDRSDYREAIT